MLEIGDIVSFEYEGTRYVGRLLRSARKTRDPLVRYYCPLQAKFFTHNIPWNDMGHANPKDVERYLELSRQFNKAEEDKRRNRAAFS